MDLSGNGVFSIVKDGTQIGYGGGSAATGDFGQGNPPRPNSGGAPTSTTGVHGLTEVHHSRPQEQR